MTTSKMKNKTMPNQPLDEGDKIEMSLSVSQEYQTVRVGATSTIRPGESPRQAYVRLGDFLEEMADEEMQRLL